MKKNIQVQQIDKKRSTSCRCGICLYSLDSVSLIHAGTKLVSAAITFVILFIHCNFIPIFVTVNVVKYHSFCQLFLYSSIIL